MLQGSLVKLVALEEEHIELLRVWRNSPEVCDYLFSFGFISKTQQKIWYQKTLADPHRHFLIIEDRESHPVGLVQLVNIDYVNRTAEWGFFIGDSRCRYGGYAAEAEFLMMKYAFDILNLNKVYGYIFAFNKKVLSMHNRFGFREEGVLKEHIYHYGKYEDIILMSICKSEYEKRKDRFEKLFSKFNPKCK